MVPRRLVLRRMAAAAVVSMLIAAFVALPGLPSYAAEETIGMKLFRFDPAELSTTTGTTVTWVNDEVLDYQVLDGTHRVVADDGSFDSGPIDPLQRFSLDLMEPGLIAYHCAIHATLMKGTLDVTGPPITEPVARTVAIVEPSSDNQTWTFRPKDLKVDEGTTVTWRNNGALQHSVKANDGSFDSDLMGPGDTFTRVFNDAESIRYFCEQHPWMEGLLRVGDDAPPPPPIKKPVVKEPVVDEQPDRTGAQPATFSIVADELDQADPDTWGFNPSSLSIRAKDTVVWRNAGTLTHTVTADDGSFDEQLTPNATFSRTFTAPGTIEFACKPHPWMKGVIVVAAAGTKVLPRAPSVAPPSVAPTPPVSAPAPDPPTIIADRSAAFRTPLAIGSGAMIVALGALMTLLAVRERRAGD